MMKKCRYINVYVRFLPIWNCVLESDDGYRSNLIFIRSGLPLTSHNLKHGNSDDISEYFKETTMSWTCSSYGEEKECTENSDGETSLKTITWKREKEMGEYQ
jgi:hypothetical protein